MVVVDVVVLVVVVVEVVVLVGGQEVVDVVLLVGGQVVVVVGGQAISSQVAPPAHPSGRSINSQSACVKASVHTGSIPLSQQQAPNGGGGVVPLDPPSPPSPPGQH